MKFIVLASLALVVSIFALIAEGQEHTVCPNGTLPTKVSITTPYAKVEGTLCGTYSVEPIVGPYLYEEDFRKVLETKGFTILENRPLQNVR